MADDVMFTSTLIPSREIVLLTAISFASYLRGMPKAAMEQLQHVTTTAGCSLSELHCEKYIQANKAKVYCVRNT